MECSGREIVLSLKIKKIEGNQNYPLILRQSIIKIKVDLNNLKEKTNAN